MLGNATRKTIISNWQRYDTSFLVLLLRKLCHTDERLIRATCLEADNKEVIGSFKRPFSVFAKDVKEVMNGLQNREARCVLVKLIAMFQNR